MDSFGQKQEISHDAKLMPRVPALFLVLVCLSGVSVTRSAEPPKNLSPVVATDLFKVQQLESPSLSPDGQWVVYVVRSVQSKGGDAKTWVDRSQLWLASIDGHTAPKVLVPSEADDSNPVWSPHGDRIAFVRSTEGGKSQIQLMEFDSGKVIKLTTIEAGASEPRWSPDGTKILFSSSFTLPRSFGPSSEAKTPPVVANPDGNLAEIRAWLIHDRRKGKGYAVFRNF
jgi:dipeptidyl aminopeptidase/acylaminoacyl peptidase